MFSFYGAMTHDRKARIWQLWRQGRPMSEIARDIQKPSATVYSYLLYHGGITPRSRVRRLGSLSCGEREAISRGLACSQSIRSIARELGRAPSTVFREISRNGGIDKYRACTAEEGFLKRIRRPKTWMLSENADLRAVVIQLLALDWSPEQISGWLKTHPCNEKTMCVSHETIHKSLFIQARGLLSAELKKHLRTKRMFRQARSHQRGCSGGIPDAISIRERPAEIEDRAVPGHWKAP